MYVHAHRIHTSIVCTSFNLIACWRYTVGPVLIADYNFSQSLQPKESQSDLERKYYYNMARGQPSQLLDSQLA